MKASEAAEIAQKARISKSRIKSEYADIIGKIRIAAEAGLYKTEVDNMSEITILFIQKSGFRTCKHLGKIIISWTR